MKKKDTDEMRKYVMEQMGSYGIESIRIGSKIIKIPKKLVKKSKK